MKFSRLVVHCKRSSYDVYIGRPGKWGNPFKVGPDGNLDEVLQKFEDYVYSSGLIKDIGELDGKILGCFCRPYRCHGDALVKLTCK